MDRLQTEREFHDRQAGEREASFRDGQRLVFADDDYLDHETWIRPALEKLGDVAGRRVLDFGCGHGMMAVVLARRGADVTAFDLSPGYLQEANRRAEANGVTVNFVQADGERLPFASGAFDAIWGNAIIHHLDIPTAAREVWRVLRPGGVAVFCEPWGGNPLLEAARRWLPYPGKQRTRDEQPLRAAGVAALRDVFPDLEVEGHQLLGMVRRVVRWRPLTRLLDGVDAALLPRARFLARFCRYVVLTLRRPR
jgi:2-polyprenyl-3-methyl-5-hydroxy-6-metoxy-1,4-benzoquinol methylase